MLIFAEYRDESDHMSDNNNNNNNNNNNKLIGLLSSVMHGPENSNMLSTTLRDGLSGVINQNNNKVIYQSQRRRLSLYHHRFDTVEFSQ